MVPPLAAFLSFLLVIDAAYTREKSSCGWAVDSCEPSNDDDATECNVRLRRWCPCAHDRQIYSWDCDCRWRKKCDADEFMIANVTVARELTTTTMWYASQLETFCNLTTCSTYPRRCDTSTSIFDTNDNYYQRWCCFPQYSLVEVICRAFRKDKWCFLRYCGYLAEPPPKPTEPPVPSEPYSPDTEQYSSDDESKDFDYWVIMFLGTGAPFILLCLCCCRAASKKSNTAAVKPPETRSSAVPVREPMLPQPGVPLPLSRLPANLREPLPIPRVGLNEPE